MALIQCPECGKEISDKVKSCPHCGYPVEAEAATVKPKRKTNRKRWLIIGTAVLIIAVVAGLTVVYPRMNYQKAVDLANSGQYEEAFQVLQKIPDYPDTAMLQEQITYETYTFECVKSLKACLKNPDSLQLYEVEFYQAEDSENTHPNCIFRYGAQNGFGGNTTGYALFSPEDFSLDGTCNSLNDVDDDDLAAVFTAALIVAIKENQPSVGSIDMERVKKLLKEDAYTNVRIID